MSVLLRVLAVEMTRPVTAVTGAVIVLFAVIGGINADIGVVGPGWANPFNVALTANLYIAPLCAGAATLIAQDVRRLALDVWLAAVPGGARRTTALRAGAVFAWAMIGYAILALEFASRTSTTGWPQPADLVLVALDVAVVIASLSLGTAAGRCGRSRIIAPMTAFALFVVQFAVSYAHGWVGRLAPVYADIFYPTYLQPHFALVGSQLLFVLAIAGLALLLVARRAPLAGVAAMAVMLGAFGIRATGADPVEVRSAPSHPICARDATISVCLRPADEFALQQSLRTLTAAVHNLSDFRATPRRFTAPGMDGSSRQDGPGIYLPPDPGAPASVYADNAVYATLPVLRCATEHETAAQANAIGDVYLWTRIKIDAASVPNYALRRLRNILAEPVVEQKRWLRRELRIVATCD